MATLEFTKELTGQFNKLASDEAKDKKKILRKELQEKSRDELSKVLIGIMMHQDFPPILLITEL